MCTSKETSREALKQVHYTAMTAGTSDPISYATTHAHSMHSNALEFDSLSWGSTL